MKSLYIKSAALLQTLKDDCGQDSVEYAILIGIVATGIIANVTTISNYVSTHFSSLATAL